MLPSNVPDWPREATPGQRRAHAALKALLVVALVGGLVGLGQWLVGLDQLLRWAVPPLASPGLPGGDNPESRNWAGYAASGGTFTGVSATWVVPQFAPDSPAGADATWVGIGGVRGTDLVQAGTQETVSGRGLTQYQAWVETLPQASRPVPLPIKAGDSVTISVDQQAREQWLIAFANNTSGQSYQLTLQYASSLSSAEWVVEAPSARRGRLLPLDTFGSITFSQASAVKDGQVVTIAQAAGRGITMIDQVGQALARPSGLGDDGGSFSVLESLL
jgi:Peptidase A4 family